PGVRLRHLHAAAVRAALASVPGDRQRADGRSAGPAGQAGAAGDHAGHRDVGLHHAGDAQRDAGGAGRGLYPHRARQGRAMAPRGLAPRAAQRGDAGGDRGRPVYRHPDRQLGADRDRVQPPRPGQHHRRRAEPARLHDAAGADGDLLLPDRGGEPDDRPDVWADRSAGETRVRRVARFVRSYPATSIGVVLCAIVVGGALFAPWLAPFDPNEQTIVDRFRPPSADYLLGTDSYGRDVLSRIMWGARVSLLVAVASIGSALVIGGAIGLVSGYVGGRVDLFIMQVMDVLLSSPSQP